MKTNLDAIRRLTISLFDCVPIEPNSRLPIICDHPFTNSTVTLIGKDMVDLTTAEGYEKYRNQIVDMINNSDLIKIFILIRSAYYLTWFSLCCEYMSEEDFAEYLKSSWVGEENPNMDVNVTLKTSISYFRKANKEYLMDEDEQKFFNNLDEEVTVYRGVSKGRLRNGLSWTVNKEKAEWFANRFGGGYLLEATIPKKYILAYLNERNEDETVVDVFKIKKYIKEI